MSLVKINKPAQKVLIPLKLLVSILLCFENLHLTLGKEIERHKGRIFCFSLEVKHMNKKVYNQWVFLMSAFVTLLSHSTHDHPCFLWQMYLKKKKKRAGDCTSQLKGIRA